MSRPHILIKDLVKGNQVWKMLIRFVDIWVVKEKSGLQHLELVIQDTKVIVSRSICIYVTLMSFDEHTHCRVMKST